MFDCVVKGLFEQLLGITQHLRVSRAQESFIHNIYRTPRCDCNTHTFFSVFFVKCNFWELGRVDLQHFF